MPTLAIVDGVKIRVYPDDHAPPHFHAAFAEHEVHIAIKELAPMRGDLPKRQMKIVLEWAAENQNLLHEEWDRLNG